MLLETTEIKPCSGGYDTQACMVCVCVCVCVYVYVCVWRGYIYLQVGVTCRRNKKRRDMVVG